MSFIAKNPLIVPTAVGVPPTPPKGTVGIFPTKDGWKQIDDEGNITIMDSTAETKAVVGEKYLVDDITAGGEIFNDYENNKAVSEYSHASGSNTHAGHYAFSFKEHEYTEADYDTTNNIGKYYLNTVEGITVGLNYTIVLNNNFGYQGVVNSVGEDYIEVTNYLVPNSDSTKTLYLDSSYIIFPDKPTIQGDMLIGYAAHSEGYSTNAMGISSHAEGGSTIASGQYSHAEGRGSKAGGYASHAETSGQALGHGSHAEGGNTKATGVYSHAEGSYTNATGSTSHAEGESCLAAGKGSHAEGIFAKAHGEAQHVQGRYNVIDYENKYAHIVGNGTSVTGEDGKEIRTLSNAHTLDWEGNAWFAGDVVAGDLSLKSLHYYGDVNIVSSDASLFNFVVYDGLTVAAIESVNTNISGDIVIPYECEINGNTYQVGIIGNDVFFCNGITSVVIPSTVTSIGENAFTGCENLKKVVIPNTVKYIGENAFAGCKNLTVKCDAGSYLETYCKSIGIEYVLDTVNSARITTAQEKADAAYVGANAAYSMAEEAISTVNTILTTMITIEETSNPSSEIAKTYFIKQNGEIVGNINIPTDMVVTGGSVETYTDENLPSNITEAGTYIVLTIANSQTDKLYINIKDLAEINDLAIEAANNSANEAKNSAYNAALSEDNANQSAQSAQQALADLLAMINSGDIVLAVNGKLPLSAIPATATQEIYVVESEDELTSLTAQRGDLAELVEEIDGERTITKTWQCLGDASVRANWVVWGTSYAVQSGNATTADNAVNANMINNHRVVEMTEEDFESAVKDADTYYLVY